MQCLHFISPQGLATVSGPQSLFYQLNQGLLPGPAIAIGKFMNLRYSPSTAGPRSMATRHEFVIGPRCQHAAFKQETRLYYCIHCKWRFLVCGSQVAVLDEDGTPLVGQESLQRFKTFEEGPCSVLEAFASAALFGVGSVDSNSHRQ
jgi:hypothetical protein